ncbi:MAG: DUF3784 domain-containing protein [Nitrososphaerota archaeon]|jgi:MFS family permease|nr:DUF3784 domain-containing protein [Nitrososphaerota archaeon]
MSILITIIFGVISALFLVMAVFLLKGKWSFLIAGYNILDEKEKRKYDHKALCHFIGGLMLVFAFATALFPMGIYFETPSLLYGGIGLIFGGAIGTIIYANTGNRFRRKNTPEATDSLGNDKTKKTTKAVKISIIIIVAVVLIGVGGVLVYGLKEPKVNVFNDTIHIEALYGLDIEFSEVTKVSLIEKSANELGVGRRVNGVSGFGETVQGHFRSDSLGETLLFVHLNASPTIQIERNNGKDIYLSFRTSEKTQNLFNEINNAITQ